WRPRPGRSLAPGFSFPTGVLTVFSGAKPVVRHGGDRLRTASAYRRSPEPARPARAVATAAPPPGGGAMGRAGFDDPGEAAPVSYLLRVVLPDRAGALGLLALALGEVDGDILSLDVVERGPGYAVDDLVVSLPTGTMPDVLVTAAESVTDTRVD